MSDNALDLLFSGALNTSEIREPASSAATSAPAGDTLQELPVELLQDFPAEKHPFRPYTQEKLDALREDIIARGIIQPLIVRPLGDHAYQIISGHNRRTAARAAGYAVLPCIIRHLDDDEALLQMISTNLQQRKGLLPSEKAFAYKFQLEAMKRQGKRTDLTSRQIGAKSRSDEQLAENTDESARTLQRYIRLTYLLPSLLDMVDEKKIGFTVGETLSYLQAKNQQIVENFFGGQHIPIDQRAADRLRELEQEGDLTDARLREIFLSPAVKPLRKIRLEYKSIKQYFPADTTEKEIRETIQEALKLYFGNRKDRVG